ncbi:unnamed protein product [Ilex paraguariensis]|uniref:Uncharacterized protein n=1 Tax=Ilex paraguariensis TaxID=185542 RepID=A0ABC8QRI3_9AQUA
MNGSLPSSFSVTYMDCSMGVSPSLNWACTLLVNTQAPVHQKGFSSPLYLHVAGWPCFLSYSSVKPFLSPSFFFLCCKSSVCNDCLRPPLWHSWINCVKSAAI